MHQGQLVIDTPRARALIAEQFPWWRGSRVERVAGDGTVNAIFRIDDGWAARFPLRPASAEEILAEAEAMAAFARHCPFATPAFVALGRPAPAYPHPWSVQTWIQGQLATPDGLAASEAFALDLAALVAALRRADSDGRRFDGPGRGGRLQDHDGWMERCFERSEGLLDVPRLRALWAGFRLLPAAERKVMSHKDLTPPNLLVRGQRLAGVLDAGGFGPADPALDLVAAWHLLGAEARAVLRRALGVEDPTWRRGAAWAFQQAMGLVWYYQRSLPGMSALGRSTLQRILSDPDLQAGP